MSDLQIPESSFSELNLFLCIFPLTGFRLLDSLHSDIYTITSFRPHLHAHQVFDEMYDTKITKFSLFKFPILIHYMWGVNMMGSYHVKQCQGFWKVFIRSVITTSKLIIFFYQWCDFTKSMIISSSLIFLCCHR